MRSRHLVLLVLLTLFWGVNWPVMKYAVSYMPPLAFRSLSMAGGIVLIFAWAVWRGLSLKVPTGEWGRLVRLSIPNMLVWHLFAISGVALLSSGRAAILGYTMPAWVALFGFVLRGQRLRPMQAMGIACAAGAIMLLLSSELGAMSGRPLGMVFMLIAAAGWAYGTLRLREMNLGMATEVLTAWMLTLTLPAMILASLAFEQPLQPTHWQNMPAAAWWAVAYNAVFVFGFCHVVWTLLARMLPPMVSSLSVMFIPVVGVFSGAWSLGEALRWQDWCAVLLVMMAVAGALMPSRQPPMAEPE